MKLIIAIVNSEDASAVLSELTGQGFSVTKLATSGGFLRAGNVTMMIGVEEEQVQKALSVIEEFSSQRKQQVPVNSTYIGDSMMSHAASYRSWRATRIRIWISMPQPDPRSITGWWRLSGPALA